jgi:hypothetical protein
MTFCTACESDDCTCPKDTLPEPLRQLLLACRVRFADCESQVNEITQWRNSVVDRWIGRVLG